MHHKFPCFSTLLFLLVASENAQTNKFIGPDRHQSVIQDGNTSVHDDPLGQFALNAQTRPKIPAALKPNLKEQVCVQTFTHFLSDMYQTSF